MRPRDPARLAGSTYDLVVIGGGIHGLTIAYEAADRGLRTALVEAADFGAGSSFNHQKTAHGGLRSLQSGRLDRARESIRERRALARIAPGLLRPLPFVIGTYRSLTRSRLALRAAFTLDRSLGWDRNAGLPRALHLPAPCLLSKAAIARVFPGVRQPALTGGAQWYDYQMVESERLTFAFAEAADRAGADLANYAEAIAPIRRGRAVAGLEVRDRLSGEAFAVRAQVVVNAAGAHAGRLMAAFGVARDVPLLKAMNLVTSRPAGDVAIAAPTSTGRMLTLVPWRGRALVGTSHSPTFAEPGDAAVAAGELAGFVDEANEAFPHLQITTRDVTLVHRGVLPAVAGRRGEPDLRASPVIHDHARDGVPGAFTVIGVKYTTARAVAERAVAQVAARLGKPLGPSRSAERVLPGGSLAAGADPLRETSRDLTLEAPIAEHLVRRYRDRAPDIVRLALDRPALAAPLGAEIATIGAEVIHAIRHEMAQHLTDIVIRRTALGAARHPGQDAVRACARVAAAEAGWDEARVRAEIAAVDAFYAIEDE